LFGCEYTACVYVCVCVCVCVCARTCACACVCVCVGGGGGTVRLLPNLICESGTTRTNAHRAHNTSSIRRHKSTSSGHWASGNCAPPSWLKLSCLMLIRTLHLSLTLCLPHSVTHALHPVLHSGPRTSGRLKTWGRQTACL
jgi:hypothetical protein